jgi:energy-coupling factor transporter ATP-binding protein EcfA2
VGLLLFQDAKRTGREFILFDDASGDYEGLDSFSREAKSDKVTGYQYKFFPSPLSDIHRAEVKSSIAHAASRSKKLTLEKYVIITPDDLKNSARREGGGDVEWFELIRKKYKNRFEVEHLGHGKLQSLFLQAPYICLYYYPGLVPSGTTKRKTIREIRTQYDTNLTTRYGRIEFVGMSVYKEEASRRIPLEEIYIPLSVVPERSPEETEDTPRADPTAFLAPGAKTVILGDPGSGKSTLMAFLALVGRNESLQKRCKILSDDRLTVIVILRRYADELKARTNLSILDYIIEVTKADFSIDAFDKDFLEFYLESGRAILLFDGLDELPGPRFKSIVRKRIESFNATYPANTTIVTSRIVGYETATRFDESFSHFRVAKLRTPEIEKFIIDWYSARIDDQADSSRNSADLVRIITNPDNDAIRDLARNPLLLTIVALVHRIDAVLPDQRVVLYQKCTETLLNTWYKAKKRDEDLAKGRIERRNRLRVEAIAYWMHRRSLEETGRAVAPHSEILSFLTRYIHDNEKPSTNGEPAEDQAEVFLEFIKSGAGLLIEAGDGLYSFIHLTFQEYLSATHLTSNGEIGGAQAIWDELGGDLDNPRWREVVRLLVASLRSTMGQRFFVEKLLEVRDRKETRDRALLLLGLLRDGIEPAEEESLEIVSHALRTIRGLDNVDDLRAVQSALRSWIDKGQSNVALADRALTSVIVKSPAKQVLSLGLTRPVIGLPAPQRDEIGRISADAGSPEIAATYERLILGETGADRISGWTGMSTLYDFWATESPEGNVAAAASLAISILLDPSMVPERLLKRELIMLCTSGYGPHTDHMMNLLAIALPNVELPQQIRKALRHAFLGRGPVESTQPLRSTLVGKMNGMFVEEEGTKQSPKSSMTENIRRFLSNKARSNPKLKALAKQRLKHTNKSTRELALIRTAFPDKMLADPGSYWRAVLNSEVYGTYIFAPLQVSQGLEPASHWQEGLRASLEHRVPAVLTAYLDPGSWGDLQKRMSAGQENDEDLDFAAWLLLLDAWTLEHGGYSSPEDSPFRKLAEVARTRACPTLDFALCVRGICLGDPLSEERLRELTADRKSAVPLMLSRIGWPQPNTGESARSRNARPGLKEDGKKTG